MEKSLANKVRGLPYNWVVRIRASIVHRVSGEQKVEELLWLDVWFEEIVDSKWVG